MKNIFIIIKKQFKDTLKNKTILIQFIMFPILTLIMENAIKMEGMPELFFTKLFSVMYIGMAPLTSVAAIISEEKEKNTLRVLLMANVKPWEYLIGVGSYVWLICMLGAGVMATGLMSTVPAAAGLNGTQVGMYLLIMGVGFIISIIAGACIGMYSKNQMKATSLVMPVMLILAFMPMLSMFNESIAKVAKFFYTQQLRICLEDISVVKPSNETYIIIIANALILIALFGVIFRKKGLE